MLKQVIDNDTFFELIKPELALGKTASFTVKGSSMWPFYKDLKTVVTVIKPNQLKKHDVVLAHFQGKVILHRIINIEENALTLRGDATIKKEGVLLKDIFGVVLSHQTKRTIKEDHKGYRCLVYLWVKNPLRRFLLKLRSL